MAGRNPLKSGQSSTPGHLPLPFGLNRAASAVPSGVRIRTSRSAGAGTAAQAAPPIPTAVAAAAIKVNSRREGPS
jgi:hypothetical protein